MQRIILIALILSIYSCRKDPIKDIDQSLHYELKNIGVIKNNDIYFLSSFLGNPEQLTHSPDSVKTDLRMSYDHQKFAYKNSDGIVEIIDKSGNIIQKLNSYNNVKSFDWSVDNQTLWLLNDNEIVFIGPEMDIPQLSFADLTNGYYPMIEVKMLSISVKGDLAYVVKYEWYYEEGSYNYEYCFIRKPNNGTDTIIHMSNDYEIQMFNELRYGPNSQDLIVGSSTGKIRLYKGLNNNYEFEKVGFQQIPVLISDLDLLLYAKITDEPVPLSKIHIEDIETGKIDVNDNFNSYKQNIYLDWKQ